MSRERIHLIGPEHRVAIVGSILANRWGGDGRELVLFPDPFASRASEIVVRPDQRGVHAELGLAVETLVQRADAAPVFAVEAQCADSSVELPFSPFGMPRSGVEFHHYWQRGELQRKQPSLSEFSLALAVQRAPEHVQTSAIGNLPLQFGLRLDAGKYIALLLQIAKSMGAQVEYSGKSDGADLTIDCGLSPGHGVWSGKGLSISDGCDIPGLEWQVCVNAARRFLALTPRLSDCENEQREYSRLAANEAERIGDMQALLTDLNPHETARSALRRKLDVFGACGRIPTEDFEVFGQPEWLAALWARGIRPRRIDRMAKAMPELELLDWLASMHAETEQIAGQRHSA